MKKIILLFLVLVNTSLFANDSEREIFYKRAKSLVRRQQLESAISLYERILKNYEPTNNIVKDYLNLVLRINEDSFLKTLERYKNDIDELTYITKQIDFLQKKGELKKSHSVADKYLKNNNNIKDYLTIARRFSSQRDNQFAIEILENSQDLSKDKYLYSLDLAKNYQQILDFDKALKHYSLHLEKNKNYQHYIYNMIKAILVDESLIEFVRKYFGNSEKEWLREIYARSLSEIGDFEDAMNIYKTLSEEKFIKFADQLLAENKFEVAKKTYEIIIQQTKNENTKYQSKYNVAKIYLSQNQNSEAKKLLLEITNSKVKLKNKKRRNRTLNKDIQLTLAEISIRENAPKSEILNYFNEAKKGAYLSHQNKISLAEINYLILLADFEEANNRISAITKRSKAGTEISKQLNYYRFLVGMMNNNTAVDSLLGELVLQIPESILTQKALELKLITKALSDKTQFFKIFRKYENYDFTAIDDMIELGEISKNENLRILAGEWALANNLKKKAIEIFSTDFADDELAGLAKSYLVKLTNNKIIAEEFLTQKPYNVLAPEFRIMLK